MDEDIARIIASTAQVRAADAALGKSIEALTKYLEKHQPPTPRSRVLRKHLATLVGEAAVLSGVLPIVDQLGRADHSMNWLVIVGAPLVALLLFGVSVIFLDEESET